jgi:PAS domain S-box-containing protein
MRSGANRQELGISKSAGLCVLGIGLLSLLGWALNRELLTSFGHALPAMKVNSALAFAFAGACLLYDWQSAGRRSIPVLLGALTASIGLATLIEYAFGVDLRIDEFLVSDRGSGHLPPGRPAITTALIFLFDGLSLALLYWRRRCQPALALALPALFIALLSFADVLYGGMLRGRLAAFGTMAMNTTIAACLLNFGILALDREQGLVEALRWDGFSGALVRRLLPAAIAVPFVLGWAALYGQHRSLYGTEFGFAILTTSTIVILVMFIWWTAISIFRVETAELEARDKLQAQYGLIAQQSDDLRRQAELIDQSNDAIITMDSDRHILSWNRGAQELYGWSAEEAADQVIHQFLQTTSPVPTAEMDRFLAETGRWDGELTHIRRDGQTVTVDSRQIRLPGKPGAAAGILEINRDVTATRKIEEQLRQAQKLECVGQLAGGVAHDFNNLLTVIGGYAVMVLEDPSLAELSQDAAREIVDASNRAAAITNHLLAFSRRQVMQRRNVVLNDVVTGMEKMMRRLIAEDIEFSIVLDSSPVVINIDPGHLEQVIMNLVINARDAIGDVGKIALETSQVMVEEEPLSEQFGVAHGLYAVLSVSDTGIGMTPQVKARIFEPFFTTKEPGKGTGLGLSTVYGIVDQNQGKIVVYSEPGRGTTFKILLPVAVGPATVLRPEMSLEALAGTETVLLVEDEERLRNYVRLVLERSGYKVVPAANGRDALDVARQHAREIDLLLTDVVMPEVGGMDLADQFSSLFPKVAVLQMSGYAPRLWIRDHQYSFIQKPFTAKALLAKIRNIFDSPN